MNPTNSQSQANADPDEALAMTIARSRFTEWADVTVVSEAAGHVLAGIKAGRRAQAQDMGSDTSAGTTA